MTGGKFKPKKGHYCIVYTRAYDLWPAGWRVVRVVKVNKKGEITHIISNLSYLETTKANKGNSLKAYFVCPQSEETDNSVLTISEYADFDLSDLDGEIYPDLDQVRKAIITG